jgi:hypothetical protein
MVAAMTAIPPPCGVGDLCDERAFGFASACRRSTGLSESKSTKQIVQAARKTTKASSIGQAKAYS